MCYVKFKTEKEVILDIKNLSLGKTAMNIIHPLKYN